MSHVSPSQTNTWARCPRKWAFSRTAERSESPATKFGTKVHAILEDWLLEKSKIFDRWKEYCLDQEIKYGGTQKRFTRSLRQKFDGITNEQSGRLKFYGGVRLRGKDE